MSDPSEGSVRWDRRFELDLPPLSAANKCNPFHHHIAGATGYQSVLEHRHLIRRRSLSDLDAPGIDEASERVLELPAERVYRIALSGRLHLDHECLVTIYVQKLRLPPRRPSPGAEIWGKRLFEIRCRGRRDAVNPFLACTDYDVTPTVTVVACTFDIPVGHRQDLFGEFEPARGNTKVEA